MGKHYTLWVKSGCSFCVKAQQELLENIKSHTIHVMDEKVEELAEVQSLWNHSTVPVVVLHENDQETFIGGYTELKEHLDTKEV
jgi:glutaredoxin